MAAVSMCSNVPKLTSDSYLTHYSLRILLRTQRTREYRAGHGKGYSGAFATFFYHGGYGVLRLVGIFACPAYVPGVRGASSGFGGACFAAYREAGDGSGLGPAGLHRGDHHLLEIV